MTRILAIESSCDETACAIIDENKNILSNVISSQIDIHKLYGGVVPEIASRNHLDKIQGVVKEAMLSAKLGFEDITAIAVTSGPGLVGALLVGVSYAKGLAYSLNKPLIPVHHIEGHIAANYIENKELKPPFLCLVVSGGHTHSILVKDYTSFEIIGKTLDDAAGEAFDKVARAIELGYPGGPKLEALAKMGNPNSIDFPKAKIKDRPYDFSFSGIKSSVLNYINKAKMKNQEINRANIAASFQEAVATSLVDKTILAANDIGVRSIAIAGGVAANNYIRDKFIEECKKQNIKFYYPSLSYCTDNAAMIGVAGYYNYKNNELAGLNLNAVAHIEIGNHRFL